MHTAAAPRFQAEITWLYQIAMAVFVVTVAIGILNGMKVVEFTRDQLLTHLHAGTIGWITLGVFATILWIYDGAAGRATADGFVRLVAVLMAVAVPFYVAAFWSGNLPARAITGAPVLLGIALFLIWLFREAGRIGLGRASVPQLGALLAITTLTIGSTIGVLLQVQLASGNKFLPDDAIGGHAAAQVAGYLALIAIAIADWRLLPQVGRRSARGLWTVGLLFVGGLLVAAGALLNIQPLLIAYIPLEIAAIVLFLTRAWGRIVRPGWFAAGSARHFAIAVPFLIVNLALIMYAILGLVVFKTFETFADVPRGVFVSLDHAIFIGVMTNAIFGLLFELNRERRSIWPWADHVLFWGLNLGVTAFLIVLLLDAPFYERFITPAMGGSILLGLLAHTLRLQSEAPTFAQAPWPAK